MLDGFSPAASKWIAFRLPCLTVHSYFWIQTAASKITRALVVFQKRAEHLGRKRDARHDGFSRRHAFRLYRSMPMLPKRGDRKRLDRGRRKQRRLASAFRSRPEVVGDGGRGRANHHGLTSGVDRRRTTLFLLCKDKRWPHKRREREENWVMLCLLVNGRFT